MKIRRLSMFLLLFLIILASLGIAKKLVYGYVTPGPDTWYRKDVEGFLYGAKLAGVEVIVLNSDYDVEKEISNIKTLVDMKVDGMCIFSFNPNGPFIAARECAKAGIPLVVTDNVGEVLKSKDPVVACIDFDWDAMGKDIARYIANNWPGEKIAFIAGRLEHVPVQVFLKSFKEEVKKLGKNEIVAIRDGKYIPDEAVRQVQDLVESGYEFSVLHIFNEEMAAAVVRWLKSRGLLNNPIKITSQNGAPYGIDLVKEGSIKYSISSSPGWEGFISFLALHAYVTGKITKQKQWIFLPITPVTKETIDDKTKVVPWDVDPVWIDLTKKYFPQYKGLLDVLK